MATDLLEKNPDKDSAQKYHKVFSIIWKMPLHGKVQLTIVLIKFLNTNLSGFHYKLIRMIDLTLKF